jgi:hypothetical protein
MCSVVNDGAPTTTTIAIEQASGATQRIQWQSAKGRLRIRNYIVWNPPRQNAEQSDDGFGEIVVVNPIPDVPDYGSASQSGGDSAQQIRLEGIRMN